MWYMIFIDIVQMAFKIQWIYMDKVSDFLVIWSLIKLRNLKGILK